MRRITFKELLYALEKDVDKYGDVLIKSFEIVGDYNELESAVWDYDCLDYEEYVSDNDDEYSVAHSTTTNSTSIHTTPCDYGECPHDAEYSRDCRMHCGLGVDE